MQSVLAVRGRRAQRAGSGVLRGALIGCLLLAGVHAGRKVHAGPFDQGPAGGSGVAAGQVPMGRTDPTSLTGFPRKAWSDSGAAPVVRPLYQSPAGSPSGAVQPVQYAAPANRYNGPPPARGPYYPPQGGYAPQGGYPPQGNLASPQYAPPGGFAPNYGAPNPGTGPYGSQPGPVFSPPPAVPPIDQTPPRVLPPPGGPLGQDGLGPADSPLLEGEQPLPTVPIDITVKERQTGQFMFGVGVNSNAGLIGNIVIDEQNFDWRRIPRSWEDIRNATAFRGAGQQLRITAMPGNLLSRYGVTFREPYLFDTRINFGVSGYYFNRFYQNWTEQRLGGRFSFGYQLTPDLSAIASLRMEKVHIGNPTLPAPPELQRVLGNTALFMGSVQLVHDTRDSPFLATQGHRFSIELDQGFGTFTFPRAVINTQKYFLIRQRADGSGRHVLSFVNDTGFTGSQTPIYENFFAGGYNTLRGFYFRGASPLDMGVQVGGKFEFLNSVEYMLPITADDSLRAVTFVDFGTVERSTEIKGQDFRIAPGLGLRVTIPAMGPAPIALDFAFPVKKAPTDHTQIFQFFMGFNR